MAWWRTGLASTAVALALGGLVPRIGHYPKPRFLALAGGYGLLALVFVIGGAVRSHYARKSLAKGEFSALSGWIVAATSIYLSVLVLLTVIAFA